MPPEAVITALSPGQMTAGFTVGLILGVTVTEVVARSVHPPALVTTTEYVELEVGLTVMETVVCPVFQEYVPPPPAVSVVGLPAQMVAAGEAVAAGGGMMLTVMLVESLHPPLDTTTE